MKKTTHALLQQNMPKRKKKCKQRVFKATNSGPRFVFGICSTIQLWGSRDRRRRSLAGAALPRESGDGDWAVRSLYAKQPWSLELMWNWVVIIERSSAHLMGEGHDATFLLFIVTSRACSCRQSFLRHAERSVECLVTSNEATRMHKHATRYS